MKCGHTIYNGRFQSVLELKTFKETVEKHSHIWCWILANIKNFNTFFSLMGTLGSVATTTTVNKGVVKSFCFSKSSGPSSQTHTYNIYSRYFNSKLNDRSRK